MALFPTLSTNPANIMKRILSSVHLETARSNYLMTRPSVTKIIKEWILIYDEMTYLTDADKVLLEDFFEEQMGLFFNWVNPDDDETYKVYFNMEALEVTPLFTTSNYYTTELHLKGSLAASTTTTTTTTTTTSTSSTTTTTA